MGRFEDVFDEQFPGDRVPFSGITSGQLDIVLNNLVTLDRLPDAGEIEDIAQEFGDNPLVIKKPVDVTDIFRHLDGTTEDTREVRVQVFPNGANVLQVGETTTLWPNAKWMHFILLADVDFHTHPARRTRNDIFHPSTSDIDRTSSMKAKMLIGSVLGITYCPPYTTTHYASRDYRQYRADHASSEVNIFNFDDSYGDFLREKVKIAFVARAALKPNVQLPEIAQQLSQQ